MICKDCGHYEVMVKRRGGSLAVEILLWIFFLIPGFIYSFYRLSSAKYHCDSCDSNSVIPQDSEIGRKLLESA